MCTHFEEEHLSQIICPFSLGKFPLPSLIGGYKFKLFIGWKIICTSGAICRSNHLHWMRCNARGWWQYTKKNTFERTQTHQSTMVDESGVASCLKHESKLGSSWIIILKDEVVATSGGNGHWKWLMLNATKIWRSQNLTHRNRPSQLSAPVTLEFSKICQLSKLFLFQLAGRSHLIIHAIEDAVVLLSSTT